MSKRKLFHCFSGLAFNPKQCPGNNSSPRAAAIAAFLLLANALLPADARAQSPTISYPVIAQDLTRGYSQANLTVKVVFNGACTGATTVKVALPASVTYVAGSVSKTAGTAALSITESSLADLSNPVFSLSGIAAVGDNITFTVARSATCGSLATAKDSVYVMTSGGCSSGSELVGSVNTYNLFSPALSITPPAALTNAVIGTTATRTTIVANGGNGVLDTLRYYVVYPYSGVVNTSGTNSITANSSSFTPSSTSGDTLFYKIYGATLFGGNNLLSNGETVTITEPVKVVKCNASTAYGAGWGKTNALQCQVATGTSAMTMANGVPNLGIVTSDVTLTGACATAPGLSKSVLTNNGTGGNAGAMYNVVANLGFTDNFSPLFVSSNGEYLSDFTFGAAPGTGAALKVDTLLVTTLTGNASVRASLSQFKTDPDGAGTGLDDLDGDGQYDDLAPGKSFSIFYYRNYKPSSICPRPTYGHNIGATATYNDMCGASATTLTANGVGGQRSLYTSTNRTASTVPQIFNGVPFTVDINHSAALITAVNQSVDSVELTITLPAGLTYVPGTFTFDGAPRTDATNVTVTATTVQFRTKLNGTNNLWYQLDFNFDLVYNCAGSGPISFSWTMDYVNTHTCGDIIEHLDCRSLTIPTVCPAPCPGGPSNISTKAERTSLGFTDATLATRVSSSSIPALQLATVLPYDTVVVTNSAQQSAVAYNNLHFNFELDKVSGQNTLLFISGEYYYKAAATGAVTNISIPAPTDLSTSSHTQWDWNLTGMGGVPTTLLASDSVWVMIKYVVANANSGQLYGTIPTYAPNANSCFYSNDASAVKQFCLNLIPLVRFIGLGVFGTNYLGTNASGTLVGCASAYPNVFYNSGYGANYRVFNNEFRPNHRLDSIVVILPPGVVYDNSVTPKIHATRWYSVYGYIPTIVGIAAPVVNGQRLTFINPGTWPLNDIGLASNQQDSRLEYSLKSTCEAGTTTGGLPLLEQYYGKDYYYDNPGVPMIVTPTYINNIGVFGIDGSKLPNITVQNTTGVVQGIQSQHYWDIQVANPSTQTAPYLWLALEKAATSGITIDSVVLKPDNVVLPFASTYGTGNNWYRVSVAGLTTGSTQQARVYFKYANCSPDSILLKAGWNCAGYPTIDPTAYACTAAQTYLKVNPQPSQVQLSVARQPGGGSSINLCTTDSALLIVNSAQAANLVNPYVLFYPPAGVTIAPTIQVEYPLSSGNYQNAAVTSIAGGGYKIDLTAHTAIGMNGLLGTALANPAFSPLGGDRQAKIKLEFTTSCGFSSGSSFSFSAYGSQPCGAPAAGNGITATTAALNITGVTVSGSAGVSIGFGSVTSASCGTAIPVSMTTTPTSVGTSAGDTMVYTLPVGMAYAGNLTAGFTADTSGTGGTTIIKIAMPAGVPASTPINYSFNVVPEGGGCGNGTITGAYKRAIAPLSCGGTPCTGSSVIIASAISPAIILNKPSLNITGMTTGTTGWLIGTSQTVHVTYANNGSMDYVANTDTIEFFCGTSAVPFAKRALTKNVVVGGANNDDFTILIPRTSCASGDLVTAKIQTTTNAGTPQCLCAASSFTMSGVPLPLTFLAVTATMDHCSASLEWKYNLNNGTVLQFAVERSSNGSDYSNVANLPANATDYADVVQGEGNWYYRIGALEVNGKTTYSKTVKVVASQCNGTVVQVYPNPVTNQFQVVIQGSSQNNSFELADVLGRIVKKGTLRGNANNRIDVVGLALGSYSLKIWTDGKLLVQKLRIDQ